MSATVQCPKCGSNAHAFFARHPFIYGKTETQVHCQLCGTRKYGVDADNLLMQAHARAAEREENQRAENARLAAEREKAAAAEREETLAREKAAAERARQDAERVETELKNRRAAGNHAIVVALAEKKKVVAGILKRRQKQIAAVRQARLDRRTAHDAAVAERGENAVCASPLCANPRPPKRMYCGKGCSNHVARARYVARQRTPP